LVWWVGCGGEFAEQKSSTQLLEPTTLSPMSSALISVIIPTCNRPEGALRAVESVVGQQLGQQVNQQGNNAIEIIVVDDGRTLADQAGELLQKYIASGQIQYIVNDGEHGAAFARNLGVSKAQGQYITFLDDDDCYLPGRLQNMLAKMQEDKHVFISSTRFHEYFDFDIVKPWPGQLSGEITLQDIKWINDIDIGILVRRQDFVDLGGYDTSFYNLEDWDFLLRLLQKGNGFKLSRQDYAENVNPNRLRQSDKGYIGYEQIAQKHRNTFDPHWYATMLAISAQGKGELSFAKALASCQEHGVLSPLKMYLRNRFSLRK